MTDIIQRRIRDPDEASVMGVDASMRDYMDATSEALLITRGRYHLTMGQLIDELRKCHNQDAKVRFPDGMAPGEARSYRGYYEDLAFEPGDPQRGWNVTVRQLLARCEDLIGSTMTGYKGGEYRILRDTPLWMSHWGEVSDIAITGLDHRQRASSAMLTIQKID